MKKILAGILVLTLVLSLAGCGEKAKDTSKEGDSIKDKGTEQVKIGLSMNTLNNPFFVDVSDGAKKAAEEKDIELFVTDAQNKPSKQQTDIENLLQKGLDMLIIDPCDSDAIVSAIETANEKGIPVMTIDRAAKGGEVIAHMGYDAIESGNIAGEFLKETLDGKGKLVEIMGIMGTNVAQDRSDGFNEIISAAEGFEVVANQSANFDRADAMKVMENILQANDKIDGVYAANDEMALGALEAIEAAGRLDEIVLIGSDAIDPALEAIRDDKLEATIAEPPFFLGKNAVLMGLDYINGEEIDKEILLDSTLVTKENIDTIVTKEE